MGFVVIIQMFHSYQVPRWIQQVVNSTYMFVTIIIITVQLRGEKKFLKTGLDFSHYSCFTQVSSVPWVCLWPSAHWVWMPKDFLSESRSWLDLLMITWPWLWPSTWRKVLEAGSVLASCRMYLLTVCECVSLFLQVGWDQAPISKLRRNNCRIITCSVILPTVLSFTKYWL